MNDQYDNERTDRAMLDRLTRAIEDGPLITKTERKIRAAACRGFSQRRLDLGEISAIRAFLTGNSDECPPEYRESYRAAQERYGRNGKNVYVYRLVIQYPEGSREPGWTPPLYRDPEWRRQLPLRARLRITYAARFRWPRERMFLTSDKAWSRAYWLKACGAQVTILRSQPVTWVETPVQEFAGISQNW